VISIVDLNGGFGNQLFQYSLAIKLKKMGFSVHIYDPTKVDYFNKKIDGINKTNNLKLMSLQKIKKIHFVNNYFFSNIQNDFNISNIQKDFNIGKNKSPLKIEKINCFNGYWQNFELVKDNIEEIKELISIQNPDLFNFSKNNNLEGKTLVHVRRGDYIKTGQALNTLYYEKSFEYLKSKNKELNLHIFTDDYEWVKSKKVFKLANYVEAPKNNVRERNTVFETFNKMLNFENYIIANSTFSWWAASLSESNNLLKICPEPYMTNIDYKIDLFDESWIKISS